MPEVMGREKCQEKMLLEKHHFFGMSFQSLNLTGLSCFVKVKDLLIRGATRGRTEDLRSAHWRGRSDKELKRWLEWKKWMKMLWNLPETAVQFPQQLVERGGVGSGKMLQLLGTQENSGGVFIRKGKQACWREENVQSELGFLVSLSFSFTVSPHSQIGNWIVNW